MTAEEMLYRAEVGYDIITGYSAGGISKKEWSIFLTEAQMDYIKIHLPVKAADISFEKSELISEQFSELVSDAIDESTGLLTTNKSLNQYGGISPYSTFYDIPSDFLYGLYSDISTYNTNCLNTQMEIVNKDYIYLSLEEYCLD